MCGVNIFSSSIFSVVSHCQLSIERIEKMKTIINLDFSQIEK